jgi:prephenate dehydrogenase
MAGSENFGPEHATADLYQDRTVLVEMGDGLDTTALESVISMWNMVGARVTPVSPADHDRLLARTSHVPHIAASAIAMLSEQAEITREFAGGGLRDITRVAAGRPELWRDICLTNSASVSSVLGDLIAVLQQFKDAVAQENADGLDRLFEDGRRARLNMFKENGGDSS